jgi:hypothetical protein
MNENKYEQLSFDLELENNPDPETDELFTENDMDCFRKDRKGWHGNLIKNLIYKRSSKFLLVDFKTCSISNIFKSEFEKEFLFRLEAVRDG